MALLCGALLALSSFAPLASALQLRAGDILIDADGGFAPRSLPRHQNAPITIHGGGRISTLTGTPPPILETLSIEFDRHGALDTTGLEVCTAARLAATDVAEARRNCPGAIVGRGRGHAVVYFPEQRPIPADSPITLFNGPQICHPRSRDLVGRRITEQPHARTRREAERASGRFLTFRRRTRGRSIGSGGHAALIQDQRSSDPRSQSDSSWGLLDRPSAYARGQRRVRTDACDASVLAHAFTTVPVPTTFIVPITIERIHRGPYGYRTRARIPPIAGGYGVPISGHLKIGRKWTYRGTRHSYIGARCETGHLQARGEFTFADGTDLSGTFWRPCAVRR